ncbi:hypothetical protein F5X97DRAFT_290301 [Nemania serpens]|nr:hypothetical protein F5X97DRAFT_290301 [Nemania serpens]
MRKRSDGDNLRIEAPRWPEHRQKRAMSGRSHEQQHSESVPILDSEALRYVRDNTIQSSRSSSPMSQESLEFNTMDADSAILTTPQVDQTSWGPIWPQHDQESNQSPWDSSLGEFMSSGDSFNSVRPPDPLYFSDSIPYGLTEIPPFLFHPRPPPVLPSHILELRFGTVLRRYNRLTKLVDDYQRWHGRTVFAFWTDEDKALAKSAQVPALTKAFYEDRPSIPPRILNTKFNVALLMAPLLSHLIERYHNDLGYRYFAFYRSDPRESHSIAEGDLSVSSRYDLYGNYAQCFAPGGPASR